MLTSAFCSQSLDADCVHESLGMLSACCAEAIRDMAKMALGNSESM
jgi:hypothetical protein